MELINVDVNLAINQFNQIVKSQVVHMEKRFIIGKQPRKEWFDKECSLTRRNVRRLYRKYHHSLDKDDRVVFCIARRGEYKNMIARKKKELNEKLLTELLNSVKCQKTFWETIKKVSNKKVQPQNNINVDQWFSHFKSVLEKEADDLADDEIMDGVDGVDGADEFLV
jgi:hypothetical protein